MRKGQIPVSLEVWGYKDERKDSPNEQIRDNINGSTSKWRHSPDLAGNEMHALSCFLSRHFANYPSKRLAILLRRYFQLQNYVCQLHSLPCFFYNTTTSISLLKWANSFALPSASRENMAVWFITSSMYAREVKHNVLPHPRERDRRQNVMDHKSFKKKIFLPLLTILKCTRSM